MYFRVVRTKIQHAIAHNFGVDVSKIYLTKPTFFSKITSGSAKTIHDEYWHPHVDRVSSMSLQQSIICKNLNDYKTNHYFRKRMNHFIILLCYISTTLTGILKVVDSYS